MPIPTTPTRVLLYARVSTEEQGTEDRHSLEAQFNEMREYAERQDWDIVGELPEVMSGTRRDRPQLQLALAMAARHEFDVLLVHELSRLSRSVYDTLDIFETLGRHNIGFASVKDPEFDFADPTKRFFLILLAAINEYYINLLRMHTSKAKRQRAREGLYNASIVPYGYQLAGDPRQPPVVVPHEKPAIVQIFELFATQRYSPQQIAQHLNAAGYRTRKGTQFSKDTVADILRNPFYAGKVAYKVKHGKYAELYDGLHEPIISPELWERCQQVRTLRHISARAMQPAFRVYLLSNLARCDLCGRKLRCQHLRTAPYYREVSYERGFTDCPHQRLSVRTARVDPQIHAIIASLTLPADWTRELEARLGDDEQLDDLRRQRERLEAQSQRLREMYLRGDFEGAREEYQRELAHLQRELEALPTLEQLAGLKAAAALVSTLQTGWHAASPLEQRDLLRLMVRSVTVDVRTGRIVTLQPQAVFIPIWRASPLLVERDLGVFVPLWDAEAHASVRAIPSLPALTSLTQAVALPFLDTLPLYTAEELRMAPGIRHALELCRRANPAAQTLVQAHAAQCPPLPADVRRWQGMKTHTVPLEQVWRADAATVDVLVTTLALWEGVTQTESFDLLEVIARGREVLTPHGVWYALELDPAATPAHWVYTFFPETRAWIERHLANTFTLYNHFQAHGFSVEAKRHVFYQPVSLQMMAEIAHARPTVLQHIADKAYRAGLERLRQAMAARGAETLIGSEIAVVEVWAQKQ